MDNDIFKDITIDKDGKARLPGKRVSINRILDLLTVKGKSIREVLARHPSLTHEDILICIIYALKTGGPFYGPILSCHLLRNNAGIERKDPVLLGLVPPLDSVTIKEVIAM